MGPTLAAILRAALGDLAWYTQGSQLRKLAGLGWNIVRVQSGQFAGQARLMKCGRPLLRWAREVTWERSRGTTTYGRFEMRSGTAIARRVCLDNEETAGSPSYVFVIPLEIGILKRQPSRRAVVGAVDPVGGIAGLGL